MKFRFATFTLSSITALALSLAPIPAVAAPDGEDIAKAVAGIIVLGIIADAANGRKDRDTTTYTTVGSSRLPYHDGEQYYNGERYDDRRVIEGVIRRPDVHRRWQDKFYKRVPLPGRCRVVVDTYRGERVVYGKRCLNKRYEYANQLPRRCEVLVRTHKRTRPAYAARCLARDGWRVANR